MSTNRLDHVAFQVSDLQRSIDFYTGTLGLRLMFEQIDETHGEAFAFMELDGGNLELLQALDPEEPLPGGGSQRHCPHVAIGVDNLDERIRVLNEKGVVLDRGPLLIEGKVRWCYFSDPDGNIIEYVEWLDR